MVTMGTCDGGRQAPPRTGWRGPFVAARFHKTIWHDDLVSAASNRVHRLRSE